MTSGRRGAGVVTALLSIGATVSVSAQGVDGYVSVMGDVFPHARAEGDERHPVSELRARLFIERSFELSDRVRLTTAGYAEGLAADRQPGSVTHAGIIRPLEVHIEAAWQKADVRIGFSRVVWGRLDEFLPTDVVNPQDVARFFFEGRSEGRLPVGLIRARLLPSDRFTLEAIYVPLFRRGRFDQLDEGTSPFNVSPALPQVSDTPPRSWHSAQGGARASVTTGRVDWSVSAFRGFESLPLYEAETAEGSAGVLHERHPRYTMVGGDFETVRGMWGWRGEIAGFVHRTLQATSLPILVLGKAIEAGLGVERKAGAYRVSSNVMVSTRWSAEGVRHPPPSAVEPADVDIDRTDLTVVAAMDRSFARETRTFRVLGVYNPREESAFARVIATFSVRDNVSLETSAGLFAGDGVDTLSRLATRDFCYARLKVFF